MQLLLPAHAPMQPPSPRRPPRRAQVAPEPGQCVRYCFDAGAVPIWPSPHHVPTPGDVPACERCGAERRFEMQVPARAQGARCVGWGVLLKRQRALLEARVPLRSCLR